MASAAVRVRHTDSEFADLLCRLPISDPSGPDLTDMAIPPRPPCLPRSGSEPHARSERTEGTRDGMASIDGGEIAVLAFEAARSRH